MPGAIAVQMGYQSMEIMDRMDVNNGFFVDTIAAFFRYTTQWTQTWIT